MFCIYQCKFFNDHANETYNCKYVSQIDDWLCINKKDPSQSATKIFNPLAIFGVGEWVIYSHHCDLASLGILFVDRTNTAGPLPLTAGIPLSPNQPLTDGAVYLFCKSLIPVRCRLVSIPLIPMPAQCWPVCPVKEGGGDADRTDDFVIARQVFRPGQSAY